jgi:hypothetical protein
MIRPCVSLQSELGNSLSGGGLPHQAPLQSGGDLAIFHQFVKAVCQVLWDAFGIAIGLQPQRRYG